MPDSTIQSTQFDTKSNLSDLSSLELAQALMEKLSISPNDWHKLKSNRKIRACEQAAAAMVFLLKDQPEEALPRLQQAAGWLDRSISAPPCPTHGNKRAGGAEGAEGAGGAEEAEEKIQSKIQNLKSKIPNPKSH